VSPSPRPGAAAGQWRDRNPLLVDGRRREGSRRSLHASDESVEKAGVTEILEDLWIDENNRPVKVSNWFTLNGQVVTSAFTMSRVNQRVTIAVPPQPARA